MLNTINNKNNSEYANPVFWVPFVVMEMGVRKFQRCVFEYLVPGMKMTNTYFFDIPVYRLAQERYTDEMDSFVEKRIQTTFECDGVAKSFRARQPNRVDVLRDHLCSTYGVWNFNEIIGYIRLYFSGSQILGEYWQMMGQKILRTRRKVFERRTGKLVAEIDIPAQSTDPVICELIRGYLASCAKKLKSRHVDTSCFDATAPYIRWRDLLEQQLVR